MPRSESFSLRLPQPLYDRLFDVIAATGNEVTRSGVIVRRWRRIWPSSNATPACWKDTTAGGTGLQHKRTRRNT